MDTSPAVITMPVNDGDARGALSAIELVNSVFITEPPTNKLELKDESEATDNLVFMDTSPVVITVPVNDGDASGAFEDKELVTVTENDTSFPNAVANSFNVSSAAGALATRALISDLTYCVVAICVVFVPDGAVGADGVPVNEGLSSGALSAIALVNPVLTIEPPTNKLELNELSRATDNVAFSDMSFELSKLENSDPLVYMLPVRFKLPPISKA